tara:strand:+ start:3452 stop:3787 length:336 start_codon:yes stop_codon:yes gene_type:complete
MKFLLFLMLSGCAKNGLIKKARNHFANEPSCLIVLGKQMEKAGCTQVLAERRQNSTLLRCNKEDKDRGRFWDNYIFRVSSVKAKIPQDHIKEIEKNTICIDKEVRIEAFAP